MVSHGATGDVVPREDQSFHGHTDRIFELLHQVNTEEHLLRAKTPSSFERELEAYLTCLAALRTDMVTLGGGEENASPLASSAVGPSSGSAGRGVASPGGREAARDLELLQEQGRLLKALSAALPSVPGSGEELDGKTAPHVHEFEEALRRQLAVLTKDPSPSVAQALERLASPLAGGSTDDVADPFSFFLSGVRLERYQCVLVESGVSSIDALASMGTTVEEEAEHKHQSLSDAILTASKLLGAVEARLPPLAYRKLVAVAADLFDERERMRETVDSDDEISRSVLAKQALRRIEAKQGKQQSWDTPGLVRQSSSSPSRTRYLASPLLLGPRGSSSSPPRSSSASRTGSSPARRPSSPRTAFSALYPSMTGDNAQQSNPRPPRPVSLGSRVQRRHKTADTLLDNESDAAHHARPGKPASKRAIDPKVSTSDVSFMSSPRREAWSPSSRVDTAPTPSSNPPARSLSNTSDSVLGSREQRGSSNRSDSQTSGGKVRRAPPPRHRRMGSHSSAGSAEAREAASPSTPPPPGESPNSVRSPGSSSATAPLPPPLPPPLQPPQLPPTLGTTGHNAASGSPVTEAATPAQLDASAGMATNATAITLASPDSLSRERKQFRKPVPVIVDMPKDLSKQQGDQAGDTPPSPPYGSIDTMLRSMGAGHVKSRRVITRPGRAGTAEAASPASSLYSAASDVDTNDIAPGQHGGPGTSGWSPQGKSFRRRQQGSAAPARRSLSRFSSSNDVLRNLSLSRPRRRTRSRDNARASTPATMAAPLPTQRAPGNEVGDEPPRARLKKKDSLRAIFASFRGSSPPPSGRKTGSGAAPQDRGSGTGAPRDEDYMVEPPSPPPLAKGNSGSLRRAGSSFSLRGTGLLRRFASTNDISEHQLPSPRSRSTSRTRSRFSSRSPSRKSTPEQARSHSRPARTSAPPAPSWSGAPVPSTSGEGAVGGASAAGGGPAPRPSRRRPSRHALRQQSPKDGTAPGPSSGGVLSALSPRRSTKRSPRGLAGGASPQRPHQSPPPSPPSTPPRKKPPASPRHSRRRAESHSPARRTNSMSREISKDMGSEPPSPISGGLVAMAKTSSREQSTSPAPQRSPPRASTPPIQESSAEPESPTEPPPPIAQPMLPLSRSSRQAKLEEIAAAGVVLTSQHCHLVHQLLPPDYPRIYDKSSGHPVPVLSGIPFQVDNDMMQGFGVCYIRDSPLTALSETLKTRHLRFFEGKRRTIQVQLSVKFKRPPKGRVWLGSQLSDTPPLMVVATIKSRLMNNVAKLFRRSLGVENCHFALGEDKREHPHFVADALASSAVKAWVVTHLSDAGVRDPLGGPPNIHRPFQDHPRAQSTAPPLDGEHLYSFAWYGMYADVSKWQFERQPHIQGRSFDYFCGDFQPSLVLYETPPEDEQHRREQLIYALKLEALKAEPPSDQPAAGAVTATAEPAHGGRPLPGDGAPTRP